MQISIADAGNINKILNATIANEFKWFCSYEYLKKTKNPFRLGYELKELSSPGIHTILHTYIGLISYYKNTIEKVI